MTEALHISTASRDDLEAVLRLYAQADIDNGNTLSIEEAWSIFDRFTHYPYYNLYVAKIGGIVVGTFELLIMDNLAHRGKPSAIIEDVVVDAPHRSRGIGRLMIEHAMHVARTHGCYKLMLSSNLTRERAHQFYERLGFRKHGYSFLVEL